MIEDHDCEPVDLLQAVAWQDGLLQAYRGNQLVLQSMFVAVGAGLSAVVIALDDPVRARLAGVLLMAVAATAISTMILLRRVITARGQAVDWWQKRLLEAEGGQPGPRNFRRYRVWQRLRQADPSVGDTVEQLIDADRLSEEQSRQLLQHPGPRMRPTIDRSFFWALLLLWGVLLGAAGVAILRTFASG